MNHPNNKIESLNLPMLIEIRHQGGLGEVLTHMLRGRDSMLVDRSEIDRVRNRLAFFEGVLEERKDDPAGLSELKLILAYVAGIQHARICLDAAGLEAIAA